MAILEEANIVCTTLGFSGSSLFLRLTRKFDVVVIDEAAQVKTSTRGAWVEGGASLRLSLPLRPHTCSLPCPQLQHP